ncbi:MAG: ABC transporter permease [Coriobacteriia bacterium]|nr:ABC transporter permease [Coriobacteriia bacterium]
MTDRIPGHAEERELQVLTEAQADRSGEAGVEEVGPQRTLSGDAWYRLRKNKLALISLVWILIVAFAALTADLWVPQNFGSPTAIDTVKAMEEALQPPSREHPMGTDDLGRDIFARVIYGARVSLAVGVLAVGVSVIIGLFLGAFSGFYGGITDASIMRVADVFLAFPYILFAILLLAIIPQSFKTTIWPVVFTIGFLGWTSIARVFRSSILSVKQNDYVDAGRALGASNGRLMARHIAPNAIAPIVVYATMSIGGAILTEAALSFLGLGVQPPTPTWGRMIEEGRSFITTQPLLVIWPGLAIMTTVLAFTLLGDGVRDALDVKMKD